mgnify:CR=1 FL=1
MAVAGRREALLAQATAFPAAPGVYLFKDARGRALYVGKADVLQDRIRAYFGPSLDVRHVRMVERADRLEYVLTGSVSEAYLLEANLIRQHRPRYNIRLKDDKSYPYVKVTLGEDFPRILRTRSLGDRRARYFGPYANAKAVDQTLDLLQKLFPYRTCTLAIVADGEGTGRTEPPSALPNGRPCILHDIGRCGAPCAGLISREAYRASVDRSTLFLAGRYDALAREARAEMASAAEALDFERAAALRDQLQAMDRTLERQDVHAYAGDAYDVLGVAVDEDGTAAVQLLRVREGTVVGRDQFFLEGPEGAGPAEVTASFVRQHYPSATDLPPELVVATPFPEQDDFARFAAERRTAKVTVHVPRRGRKRTHLELAERNAVEGLQQLRVERLAHPDRSDAALRELAAALGLGAPPARIECYDVSHVQGTDVVASMVVFQDGRPLKAQYRRFRARSGDRNDDVGNMRDTLARRFRRAEGDDAWPLPDLVVIDGGRGQLAAGLEALAATDRADIAMIGLAKEHLRPGADGGPERTPEEVYLPDRPDPLLLPRTSQAYFLLQRVRDEAHRFAVTYHQKLRGRRQTRSELDDVAGIGPARKRALLRAFGSVRGLRDATVEDVAGVAGVGAGLAERVKHALG